MSRYFAEQSREYRVAKYEIGEVTVDDNKDVIVGSKIIFFLAKPTMLEAQMDGGTYKVADVVWVHTYLQAFVHLIFPNASDGHWWYLPVCEFVLYGIACFSGGEHEARKLGRMRGNSSCN
jgi:hypothetical protein